MQGDAGVQRQVDQFWLLCLIRQGSYHWEIDMLRLADNLTILANALMVHLNLRGLFREYAQRSKSIGLYGSVTIVSGWSSG